MSYNKLEVPLLKCWSCEKRFLTDMLLREHHFLQHERAIVAVSVDKNNSQQQENASHERAYY